MNTVARARDLALGHLRPRDAGVHRGVVLDRPLDLQIGPPLAGQARGLAHLSTSSPVPDSPVE